MVTISLCMIVKDEENYLERCLNPIKDYVDEIIIVDTGSSDKTKEIAKKFTSNVFDFAWVNDFSKARNFALSKATKEWILVLDADEIINQKDMDILRMVLEDADFQGYYLIQRNYTDKSTVANWTSVNDNPLYEESKGYKGYERNPVLRLFRNNLDIIFKGEVHEVVDNFFIEHKLKYSTLQVPIHHAYEEKNNLENRQQKYLDIAENALKGKPDGRLYASAAAIYLYFKKDYKKALDYFQKAIYYGYKVSECAEGIAECHIGLKGYDKAYEIYKELVKKGFTTYTVCNNIANILVMYRHYEPALKFLKLALSKGHPDKERIVKNIETIEQLLEDKQREH